MCLIAALLAASALAAPEKPDYNREVRPILSGKCFTCHGGDEAARKANLRLDEPNRTIIPGDVVNSELARRILAKDASQMPPAHFQKPLTDTEKRTLLRWIDDGADYQKHWAFLPPKRLQNGSIDKFVSERLTREGWALSPPADRVTLIRRVSYDLTGLPPTPAEVDAFVADKNSNAYEKVVDRLLASPRYGEKMAQQWMDLARYADSNGFQADYERYQWRWRDWAIEAFNKNLPFDQFTVQQLAGDLLPNATHGQILATGFHRNHRINTEGGLIAEEWRVENVVDRLETTGAVWLGLTAGCARCHDHKYDPISQKEFYQLYAFFNNVPESGAGLEGKNTPPVLKTPMPEQETRLAALAAEVEKAEQAVTTAERSLPTQLATWEADGGAKALSGVVWRSPEAPAAKTQKTTLTLQPDGTFLASGTAPATDVFTLTLPTGGKKVSGIRLDVFPVDGKVGRFPNGNFVLTDVQVNSARPIKASADYAQDSNPVSEAIDGDAKSGWGIYGKTDQPHSAIFSLGQPATGDSVTVTLAFESIYEAHQPNRFKITLTDAADPQAASVPTQVLAALETPATERTEAQKATLLTWFRTSVPGPAQTADRTLAAAKKARADYDEALPTTMVMAELPQPRPCYVLKRGQYDQPGEVVTSGIPAALGSLPAGSNRLAFARWVASPQNPLTARVFVNRLWEKFFGTGIVATTEDFGTRAEFPSHPELLDWLATEFVRLGWDMKAIQRTIVLSETYRQGAKITPDQLKRDPENRLLAHAPRLRLPAEAIRDGALLACGLLVEKQGGPSVRPYQPDGFWDELSVYGNLRNYKHDTKPDGLYRRSLYTIWKRSAGPPTMALFDVPGRDTCRVRRSRTNTPLQALALLNEVTFVEAARVLAQKGMAEGGAAPEARITWLFRQVVSRRPDSTDLTVLKTGWDRRLAHYRTHPEEAKKLLTHGDAPVPANLDSAELAAYTTIASVIMNLDEAITRE